MSLIDKCEWLAELVFKVSRNYRTLFDNKETKEQADAVLHDLAKFCGVYELSISANQNDLAPLQMARMMGRLEVYQHVQKYLKMTENQKREIASRLYEAEQQQIKQGEKFI